MKILKIAFQNINSLKGTHEIDFREHPFTSGFLFAITGPTGSGKSTLLDVISLGLFSHVPRLGKITRGEIVKNGAILTRNQNEAFAQVTYSCKSGIYRSTWSISTNRRGNLREYDMQLMNLTTQEVLDLRRSEVPSKNEELIGLNYSQFIKSVLLAQGEFAQLLKAKKAERAELLEKITGTGIYRRLGQLAFEKHKAVTVSLEKQQHELDLIQEKTLAKEEVLSYTNELTQKSQHFKETETKVESLKKELDLKKEILQQKQEIASTEQSLKKAQAEVTAFESAHGRPLQIHEQVRHCAEELRQWTQLQNRLEALQGKLKQKQVAAQTQREKIAACLEETSLFTGNRVLAETISQHLDQFAQKVSKLQQDQKDRRSEFQHLGQQLRHFTQNLQLDLDFKLPEKSLKKLQKLHEQTQEELKDHEQRLGRFSLQQIRPLEVELRELHNKGREALEQQKELERLRRELGNLEKEVALDQKRLEPLPDEIRKLEQQEKLLKQELEVLVLKRENELLHARVEDLREKLRAGEPCPLCGATEHPFALETPPKNEGIGAQVEQKEKQLRDLQNKVISSRTSLQNLTQEHQRRKAQTQERNQEIVNAQNRFNQQFEKLQKEKKITDWQGWCLQLEKNLEELSQYELQLQRMEQLKNALPLHQKINEVIKEGQRLSGELEQLYKGKDIHADCNKLKDNWVQINSHLNNLQTQQQELQKELEERSAELTDLEKTLEEALTRTPFNDIKSARAALLPDPEVHRLQNQRDTLNQQYQSFKNKLELLSEQLIQKQAKESNRELVQVEQELKNHEQALHDLQKRCEDLRHLLKNEESRQREIKAIKERMAAMEKGTRRWKLLKELIGDATGKKFNDFAQDLSLTQLLILANRRLRDLNDRYVLDKPEPDEDDGLIAIDAHMGGQRRSVKTLSGGETFILSLAMALALSDLASKNVEIDSLFIDEGFGSLDPEMLDQTLDTLERLQAESSKTIGIISHVESLKERIATQIRLERNGQGYSQLRISSR